MHCLVPERRLHSAADVVVNPRAALSGATWQPAHGGYNKATVLKALPLTSDAWRLLSHELTADLSTSLLGTQLENLHFL